MRTTRKTRGAEIVLAMTVVPLLVGLAYIVYRALLLIGPGGILYLIKSCPQPSASPCSCCWQAPA